MILIEKVEEYSNHLLTILPELKKAIFVVDDSQLANVVKDFTESDNIILVAVLPSHKSEGTNMDDVRDLDLMLWLVLEKIDSKEGHDETMNSFKRTQKASIKIKQQMLKDKPNFTDCHNVMKMLEISSIEIDPIWRLAGTNGYEINYRIITPTY